MGLSSLSGTPRVGATSSPLATRVKRSIGTTASTGGSTPPTRLPGATPSTQVGAGSSVGGFQPVSLSSGGRFRLPTQTDQRQASRQRSLLGQFGQLLPPGEVLRQADIPLLETNLNFQQLLMAELDRQRGIDELRAARAGIGQSEDLQLASQVARDRLERGPGEIASASAVAGQGALNSLAEELARRGLSGGIPAYAQAQLGQQLSVESMLAQRAAEQSAMQDLLAYGLEEELRRLALDQALAGTYLETQREPISLASLVSSVPRGRRAVGVEL